MFARKPTNNGVFPSFERPTDTSVNKSFDTVPASITLQDAGSAFLTAAMRSNEHVNNTEDQTESEQSRAKIEYVVR